MTEVFATADGPVKPASPAARAIGWAAVVLGIGLPLFLSFNFVYRFAVDVPYWDQWEFVPVLQKWSAGTLTFADLFALHNEHRLLFPRIVMLVLASLSGWDTRWEMWVGWAFLVGIGAVLFTEHRKTFGSNVRAAALFIPAAWMIFTLRQTENLLWGWQLQISLCSLALCGAIAGLAGSDARPRLSLVAIASAVVCCFSFAAGLAVWPAGLFVLLWRFWLVRDPTLRRQRLRILAGWSLAGVAAVGLYLIGYHKPGGVPSMTLFLEKPLTAVSYVLVATGSSLAENNSAAGAMGLALVAILVALGIAAWRGLIDPDKASVGLGLIAFSFGSVAMVTIARLAFAAGSSSRYTTLTMLGVVGLLRLCLAVRAAPLRAGLLAAMCALVFQGTFVVLDTAYPAGTQVRRARQQGREVLRDWRHRTDEELQTLFPAAAVVRERAPVLETLHSSVFRTQN